MPKFIAFSLVVLLLSGATGRSAPRDEHSASKQDSAPLKQRIAAIPLGTPVAVKAKDGIEHRGKLVARGEEEFQIKAPGLAILRYDDVEYIREIPAASPHGSSARHIARRMAIGVAVVVVFVILAAVELRKA
jgi:hypothetical protein